MHARIKPLRSRESTMSASEKAIEDIEGGCRIHLHVVPRASRTQVMGLHDGRVKLQVAAPPVDGEANAAIIKWAAKLLGVTRDSVHIASGATGKRKTVAVSGVSREEALARLALE